MSNIIPEPQAHDLNELFNRDPLDLTNDELDFMVEAFRKDRAKFQQEEETAKKENRRPRHNKIDLNQLKLEV